MKPLKPTASDPVGSMIAEVRAQEWVNPDAQAQYLRVLEATEWSLHCVLAGTGSDRRQAVAEWAKLLLRNPDAVLAALGYGESRDG